MTGSALRDSLVRSFCVVPSCKVLRPTLKRCRLHNAFLMYCCCTLSRHVCKGIVQLGATKFCPFADGANVHVLSPARMSVVMVNARVSGPARTDDVLDPRNSENSSGQTFLVANSRDEARAQGIGTLWRYACAYLSVHSLAIFKASISFVFQCLATSSASGSSGLGALSKA
jgi:hypothetical protein